MSRSASIRESTQPDLSSNRAGWAQDAGLVTELEKNAELPSGISCNDGFGDFLRAMCARDFEVVADCLIDFHDPKASPCIGAKSDER